MTIEKSNITGFYEYLVSNEKSSATIEKYVRDVNAFNRWLSGRNLDKCRVLEYKAYVCKRYSISSVNSIISSLNSFFNYLECYGLRVKTLKVQKQIFINKDQELSKKEYEKLLDYAKKQGKIRLYFLMQTICSTGIRISELRFVTVEALDVGFAEIFCKGKIRAVILPTELCKILKKYTAEQKIISGPVFVSKNGNPLNRSNIWNDMKSICASAGVSEVKVFPHNLRHLFARSYYSAQKDVVRLADILGHSNVNTTRIYTMESGEVHRKQIQSLGLIKSETT